MTFAFDEQFAMFDITPVENQFITEYLPGTNGDYVKVYLYGLLYCYHPKEAMNPENMARELNMTEEQVLAAFRYWERRGIVRRICDHPPEWQYINIKQKSLDTDPAPEPDYIRFSRDLESSFEGSRDFHGSETAQCYEWKEELGIPTEVIILLLKYMSRTRGKNFKVKDAEKLILMLKDENALTLEEAEEVLSRDEIMTAGFRKILRKMGMRFNPSDANMKVYRKWIQEWHFTQEAIEDACDRTGKSTPSLALVDSILERTYKSCGSAEKLDRADLQENEEYRRRLKEALKETGQFGPATPAQEELFKRMNELYPQNIILLAARECASRNRQFDSVLKLLDSWKERGFQTEKQILEHINLFHEKEKFLKEIKGKWNNQSAEIGQKSIQLLDKWENELGFSREMISLAADSAFEVKKPVAYMDKLLTSWAEKGIRTAEDVQKEQRAYHENSMQSSPKSGKNAVSAQQYSQRDYTGEQEEAMRRMISSMNGGENNA